MVWQADFSQNTMSYARVQDGSHHFQHFRLDVWADFFDSRNMGSGNREVVFSEYNFQLNFGRNGRITAFVYNGGWMEVSTPLVPNGEYKITLECSLSNLLTLSVDDVVLASLQLSSPPLNYATIDVGGRENLASGSKVERVSILDLDDGYHINLDATLSDHNSGSDPITNPFILTNTINGNNAIGVNMPTDGSAWIDLGGGAQESSVSFSLNKPVFTASIINESLNNTSNVAFNTSKPVFNASITNDTVNNESNVGFSIIKPVFSASIENQQVNNVSSASFTINKPVFNASISNSAGTNISSVSYSIKKPVFSASISNDAHKNTSTIGFATNKPVFSASILNELIKIESSVSFSINKPVFSIDVQNGDVVVKFNEDTNYTQEYLSTDYTQEYSSTNYEQPYLSTNYTQG